MKHFVRVVEWTFVVDMGFQRAFVGSMFEVDHTSSPGSQGFSMYHAVSCSRYLFDRFRVFVLLLEHELVRNGSQTSFQDISIHFNDCQGIEDTNGTQ